MAGAQPLILMYHRVGTFAVDPRRLAMSPARFAEQIDIVAANRRPIALGEMARAMRAGTLADDAVAITFDDGYAANIAHALPALRAHSVPATMFVTSGYVGGAREFWWDELERILLLPGTLPAELPVLADGQMQTVTLGDSARYSEEDARRHAGWRMDDGVDPRPRHQLYRRFHKRLMSVVAETDRRQIVAALADWAGRIGEVRDSHRQMTAAEIGGLGEDALIEIGGHTMTHPVLAHLPAAAQTQEIRDGKAALEAMAGCTIDTFAYPFGGIDTFTGETVELLRREGFVCAATTVQSTINARTDAYRLPRVRVQDWTGEDFAQRIGATLPARTTTPAPAQVPAQPVKPDGATALPAATVLGGQARAATTVLLFTDSHSFCGIGQKSAVLLEALRGAGYRVVCAQRHEATPLQDRLSELGVEEYVWFETNPDDDKKAFALDRVTSSRIFSTIQPDLIVFANGRPMGSYSAKAAAAFLSIPYIIIEATTARKLLPQASEPELRDTTVAQYLDARAVVTVCQENLDNLKSALSLPLGFGQVIYQGPGEAFLRPRMQPSGSSAATNSVSPTTRYCASRQPRWSGSRAMTSSSARSRRCVTSPSGTRSISPRRARGRCGRSWRPPSPSSILPTG